MNINEETIELIISERFNEDFWLFELGRLDVITTESLDVEHQFMNSFLDKGKRIWDLNKEKLENALCDKGKKEPKEFIKELTEGNIKDLVGNIITVLTATYSMTLAISIPLCALALKKGIHNVCK